MRGIHKDNIEEWFFQYHEGLLDDTQKKDLLHFLVENPEYNDDFVLWGSARLSVEELSIPEEFSEQLKRKAPVVRWQSEVLWSFGASICLSLLSLLLMRPSSTEEVPRDIPTVVQQKMPSHSKNTSSDVDKAIPKIESPSAKYINAKKEKAMVQSLIIEVQDSSTTYIAEPLYLQPIAMDSHAVRSAGHNLGVSLSLQALDSSKYCILPLSPITDKKWRNGHPSFSIKPVQEFQSDHPNF